VPDQSNVGNQTNTFYDIEGLIDEQIKLLDSIGPSIIKKATVGLDEEINRDDGADWSNELLVFRSADINKPLLRDSYEISNTSKGNFRTTLYISKSPGETTVDKLSVQKIGNSEKAVKIHARLDSKNPLFGSAMTLEMDFQSLDGKHLLTRYASHGWQKMVSKDSTYYSIETELVYP